MSISSSEAVGKRKKRHYATGSQYFCKEGKKKGGVKHGPSTDALREKEEEKKKEGREKGDMRLRVRSQGEGLLELGGGEKRKEKENLRRASYLSEGGGKKRKRRGRKNPQAH